MRAVGHSLSIQKFGQTENQTRARSDEERRHAKGETGDILVEALFHRLSIRLPLSFGFKRNRYCRSVLFLFFFFFFAFFTYWMQTGVCFPLAVHDFHSPMA